MIFNKYKMASFGSRPFGAFQLAQVLRFALLNVQLGAFRDLAVFMQRA